MTKLKGFMHMSAVLSLLIGFGTVLIGFGTVFSAGLVQPEQEIGHNGEKGTKGRNGRADENAGAASANTAEPIPTLWEEPSDIENRDLFYGPGGQEGAPDPAGKFTFVRRSTSGTQEKIIVRDDKNREWTVKFGPEAKPETAATRIVWAAGYHVDQTYFIERTHIEGRGGFDVWDVRFERRDDGLKEVGNWSWESNPFVGAREFQGLKTLMALLKSWDLKATNNKIVRPEKDANGRSAIYYVADLGATLGATGSYLNKYPFLGELSPNRAPHPKRFMGKGNPEAFKEERFIEGVRQDEVIFRVKHKRAARFLKGVKVENARWMGNLLARLSAKQLKDAFRASGFSESDIEIYVSTLRERIEELRTL